jgi:hypothetical protein
MSATGRGSVLGWVRWRGAAALVVLALVTLGLPLLAGSAQAATGARVDLRVLVVSNGDSSVEAIATQLDREGVPFTKVAANPAGRPAIDAAFLSDAATQRAKFQAVVLPNQAGGGLAAAEVAALTAYERLYGIRQVNAYDFPGATMGLQAPAYTGSVDGGTMTVTAAGKSGSFAYLDGTLPLDDVDTAIVESYGYLAQPVSPQPAGQTFSPLLTGTVGAANGVLAGVFAKDGREELVLTTAYNSNMQWWNEVASGVVSWMTRGVHLGYQRNYFAVHVDDVFLPDGRWSVSGNCTPGDNCVDPATTTTDIRMSAADVDRLIAFQNANAFKLDMVYNGGGSAEWKAGLGLAATAPDPLLDRFIATQAQFPWINHTFTHPFLGCIQIAPTVQGQPWKCATSPTETPRQDPTVPQQLANGVYWASQAFLQQQIQDNQTWGAARFTDFDPAELVTGEHSGLATLPEQTSDNPFLGPVLTATGVKYTASDNSRETNPRVVGGAVTVPRFPMNVFYNAGTYQDQVDEYNWIYTSAANGGSDICSANPATSTCITPLPAGTNAQAKTSFDSYIVPLEARNALSKVITNNPRPFYAHQSNLAEDGILYPVVKAVLDGYRGVYADNAPIVRTDMTTQSAVLARQAAWRTAAPSSSAWIDSDGIHVTGGSTAVPLTVPTGTTVTGATMESYAGELSAWTSGTVNAVPTTPMAGYVGTPAAVAPGAPTIGLATAGNASATVNWTAPASNGGSAITAYRIAVHAGDAVTPLRTVDAPPTATSFQVTGLTNGQPYTFTVAAVNAVGAGTASARSVSVTPAAGTPSAPTITGVTAGNASATLTWAAPATDGGANIANYTVSAYVGTGAQPLPTTVTTFGGEFTAVFPGLTNGTAYTFTVTASNSAGAGAPSARSTAVTPATVPDAPTVGAVTAGNASATVTWTGPAANGGSAVTGYRVDAYAGTATTPARTVTAGATASSVVVDLLTNGTSYTFTVTATNAVGSGTPSARSTAVTPAAPVSVPGAPTIGTVTAGNTTATLTWTAPAGGSAVTGYRIDVFVGTATTPLRSVAPTGTATTAVVDGLSNGTAYTFTVTALNSAGAGPASARSTAVTPAAPVTVPGAPTIGTVTPGNASATVNWTAPTTTGGAALTGYRIEAYAGTATTPVVTATAAAGATSAVVTGLTNGTSYTFLVRATNSAGTGTPSARSAAVTPVAAATVPAAPAITSVTAKNAAVTVAWSAPANGGSPITGYTVTVYQGTSTTPLRTVVPTGTVTTADVTGLTNGTSYTFTVTARNAVGSSPASARSAAVTPATVANAPTIGQVTPGNASATVRWTAPAVTGGSPITGYTVKAYVGTATTPARTVTVAAASTSTVVSALTNGTAYTFTVAAVTAAGTSPESARSASVTPNAAITVPGAPTIGTATRANSSAVVNWAAPAQTGGSAITGYQVAVYSGTSTTPLRTVPAGAGAVSLTVTGLTNGTAYTFTVAAVNAAGTGARSARSNSVIPAAVASAPATIQATPGHTSATLTWTAPASIGGSSISGYVVQVRTGTQTIRTVSFTGTATRGTVTGLTNGTAYTFTVAAVNTAGTGPASVPSNQVVPSPLPGAPALRSVTPSSGTLTVAWAAPVNVGGSAISGYVVRVYAGTTTTLVRTVPVGVVTQTAVTGLTNGTGYSVTVSAVNSFGTGAASTRSAVVQPATPPGAPTLRTVTAGNTTATVSWTAPTVTGGSPITGYRVSVYQGTSTTPLRTVITAASTTQTTVGSLTNGADYRFRVAAVNAAGVGPQSSLSAVVRPAA